MKKRALVSLLCLLPLTGRAIEEDICGSWQSDGTFHPNPNLRSTTPSTDFEVVEGEPDVVRHLRTGLEWQRCFVGQTWNEDSQSCDGEIMLFPTLIEAVAAIYQIEGWRMPNLNEAGTIVERCKTSPALNTQVFPVPDDLGSVYIQTSTPYVSDWNPYPYITIINVDSGMESVAHPDWSGMKVVRLVRDSGLNEHL